MQETRERGEISSCVDAEEVGNVACSQSLELRAAAFAERVIHQTHFEILLLKNCGQGQLKSIPKGVYALRRSTVLATTRRLMRTSLR